MSIAVILPLYNHAKTLPLSVHSVMSQTRQPDQVIIVNDGSTDGGGAVADRLAAEHPAIRVIHHGKNKGVVAALNTGLNAAETDYVICSAADDALLPDLIARATTELAKYPEAGLFCSEVAIVNPELDVIGFRPSVLPTFRQRYVDPNEARNLLKTTDNWIVGSAAVYKRAHLIDIGGFDEKLGSMCDGLASRYIAMRYGFIFSPEVLAIWRVVATSVSHSRANDKSQLDETIRLANDYIGRHQDYFPKNYESLFERRYIFASERVRLAAYNTQPIKRFARLARLFLKYAPTSFTPMAMNAVRLRWLAGRGREVERVLARYMRETASHEPGLEAKS
ncbi:MAG: glycosyltransferase family 2 protein [Pseudomonadota bacterium]